MKDNVASRKFSHDYLDGKTAVEWVRWAQTLQWLYGESESSERNEKK